MNIISPLSITGIIILVLFILWVLVNLKTSRPDGKYVKKVHRYRQVLWFLIPNTAGSQVFFDDWVDAEPLLDYLDKSEISSSVTHAVVAAAGIGFAENPSMNQFVNGYRLYHRNDIYITFTMKREKMGRKAALSAVKLKIDPSMSFADLSAHTEKNIKLNRSGEKTYTDKELGLLSALPRPVFKFFVEFSRTLNYWNLLPGSFIKSDPMFTSLFIANLGSIGMNPGYHHLYEWGTCPLFLMVGEIQERPVVVDGEVKIKKMLHLRYTFDERLDDGLNAGDGIKTVADVLTHPERDLGCLKADKSDYWLITTPRAERPESMPVVTPSEAGTDAKAGE